MSEPSKTPRWLKVALAIQAIVICLGLWFFTASVRSVREVQLPAPSEELSTPLEVKAIVKVPNDAPLRGRAFADVPKDAPATRSPDVPGQPSVVPALPPNLVSSTPLALGSDGRVSLGEKNIPSAPQPTTNNSDPADLNPPLSNPNQPNPQLPNLQNPKAMQSNSDVTIQQFSDVEIPNSNPVAVNETTTRKNLSGSANEIRVFRLQNRTSKEMFLVVRDVFDNSAQISVDERSNSLIVVASQPILQKVSDFITEMESQAGEPVNTVDRPAISRTGAVNSVAQFPSDERDAEFDRQARQVALQIRTARPNEKGKLKNELESITRKQFEHRQHRRREEFDSLGQRVERLKSSYQRRQTHQDEVIQRRINDLLDPNTDLRWDESETTGETLSSRNEAANVNDNSIETATQGSPFANQTPSNKSLSTNSNESDPTYNSVTLSQWMRLLETERNIEKIAEAVEAMNHLMDQADPTQLTRIILRIMRFHGSRLDDYTTDVMRNGSVNLLKLLPSEIVVEELISELAVSSSRKPTQDFYSYFLSSVETQGATDTQFPKKNTNWNSGKNDYTAVEPSVLSDSTQRLRVEIRRRSRRLIGVLVNAANTDENLAKWAMRCAGSVVHISDRPITTYPGLGPLVERMFDHPVDVQKVSSWSYSGAVAAMLLGESGLRVSDVLAFAAKRIDDEGYILAPKYAANGMRCLVAIAPFSLDAVNLLGDRLEAKWAEALAFDEAAKAFSTANPFEKTIEDAKKGPPDEAAGINLKQQCMRIIEALAKIGNPAVPAIPKLTAIAESPKIVEFTVHNNYAKPETTNLQDLAKSTIKKIEESKPKSNPQPLPVDEKISTRVPIIASPNPGVSPVTDQPLHSVVTPVSDSKTAETTYDGVAYSQWLKLLETERKPEKLIAAIEACSLIPAKGDERRIARLIFLAEGYFESKNWENGRPDDVQAGCDALARLPGDAVVDELLHALRDEKSYSTGRSFHTRFLTRNDTIPHARQMREKAGEIIAELLKRNSMPGNSKETKNTLLAAASSVWLNSGQPMKEFDGLWPELQKLLSDGYGLTDSITFESQEWMIAATNVVVGAPQTPDLAIVLLAQAKKHDPHGAPIIALIGKLGPHAESVVPELVELFLVKLKKLESLPPGMRKAGAGGYYPANANAKETKERNLKVAVVNEEQQTRVALVRALGEIGIGQKGYYLLSELKLIATNQMQPGLLEFLDEILNAADEALQKFGSIKYPRDEKRLLSDRWRLNGRWRLVTKFENSETDERPREISVQIREDQLNWETVLRPDEALAKFMDRFVVTGSRIVNYTTTVDDTKLPKQIMLSAYFSVAGRGGESKLHKMAGIYKLTDDKLKIQFAKPDQPSPTEFTNEMGHVPEDQILLEFERIVPEATKNVGGQGFF